MENDVNNPKRSSDYGRENKLVAKRHMEKQLLGIKIKCCLNGIVQ